MRIAALALLTAAIVSCSRPPPDATPEGALREWLDRMDAQVYDVRQAPSAYALLSKPTRDALDKRADRASRIEGHHESGLDVLAQGRFALRFRPTHFTTTITGDVAAVEVTGDAPGEHAVVHCLKEGAGKDARWRVDLALPELTDLPRRPSL